MGRAQERKTSSTCGPSHLPHDPCSSSHNSAWYWACRLLVRIDPGLGIRPGWVQVGQVILLICCNSISASNLHALLPSFPPPSGLSWGKGELRTLQGASEGRLEVLPADHKPRAYSGHRVSRSWMEGPLSPPKEQDLMSTAQGGFRVCLVGIQSHSSSQASGF